MTLRVLRLASLFRGRYCCAGLRCSLTAAVSCVLFLQEVAEQICLGSPVAQCDVSTTRGHPFVDTPLRWGIRTWAPNRELMNIKPSPGTRTLGMHQPPVATVGLRVSGRPVIVPRAGRAEGAGMGDWGQQRVTGTKESKRKGDKGQEAAASKTTGASAGSLRHSFRSKHWYT